MLLSDEVKTKVGPLSWTLLYAKNSINIIWVNHQKIIWIIRSHLLWPYFLTLPSLFPWVAATLASLWCLRYSSHVLYAGPLYLLFPRSHKPSSVYSGLLKFHLFMKDFFTIPSTVVLKTLYLPPCFFLQDIVSKVSMYVFRFSLVSTSSIGMPAYQGSSKSVAQHYITSFWNNAWPKKASKKYFTDPKKKENLKFNKFMQHSQCQNHYKSMYYILYHKCFQNVVQSYCLTSLWCMSTS